MSWSARSSQWPVVPGGETTQISGDEHALAAHDTQAVKPAARGAAGVVGAPPYRVPVAGGEAPRADLAGRGAMPAISMPAL